MACTSDKGTRTPTLTAESQKPDKMKHLAAYLLLGLGGNASPSAADIKSVLESVGIEADDERLEKLLSELEGKDINEVRKHSATRQRENRLSDSSRCS